MPKFCSIIFSCLFLASCAVGPDYSRPETKVSDPTLNFINSEIFDNQINSINQWWDRIDDPLLDTYVDQLVNENLALIQAGERILQAREQVNIQQGSFFPSLGAGASASRSFSSFNSGAGIGALSGRNYVTSYNPELTTSWELDIFGKIRRSAQSAESQFQASIYDREALTHALIAELLNRRIAISVNKRRLDLAKQNVNNRQDTYDLVKNRYDLGVRGTSLADVYLAKENLTTVKSDIHEFERLLAEETYRFDVLLGQLPGTTNPLEAESPLLPTPLDIPTCLPADLLDRRPDLRASELRLAAATSDIGVAIADLYPSFIFNGSIGFSGDDLSNLFTADKLAGSILGNITTRLFEGGRLRANIRLREAVAREQAAVYSETILEAVREVETALKAEKELKDQIIHIEDSADALRNAENISRDRYLRGILTLRNFLDTQQRRYNVEQSLLLKQREKWSSRISLYLALGGDWFSESNQTLATCGKGF